MTSSNHPRFRLLIGWCCLMSSAILLITVYLSISPISLQKSDTKEKNNSAATSAQRGDAKGSPMGPSVNSYIRLIRDEMKPWICSDSCDSSSLSLKNDSVQVKTSGLYYIHAQVSFKNVKSGENSETSTVQLIKNGGHGTQKRRLSELSISNNGSVTMIRHVQLAKEDSIRLEIEIKKESAQLLKDEYHTYWEIILLSGI